MKKWKRTKRQRNRKRHRACNSKIQIERATYKLLKIWSCKTNISIEKLIAKCCNYYKHNKDKGIEGI